MNKSLVLLLLVSILLGIAFSSDVNAQAFPNDNDGLLDVGEAPGFPTDPASATGELTLNNRGIGDIDGTSLLINLQGLSLRGNQITSIGSGDFDGLANLQELGLGSNRITSIESGDFDGLPNLQVLSLGYNGTRSIDSGDFDVLASEAKKHSERVEVIPTPIDLRDYPESLAAGRNGTTVVWLGLPKNLMYVEMIRPVLAELTRDYPELRLRIVSSEFPDWPEVPLEKVRWTVEDEPRSLATADIGVMPLSDDEWSRGKCAFKLLQYMSAGLPCVASPVGANRQAVVHGRTGYLAGTLEEWAASLRRLLDSSERRATFGLAGRRRVEDSYSRSTITPRTVRALRSALD